MFWKYVRKIVLDKPYCLVVKTKDARDARVTLYNRTIVKVVRVRPVRVRPSQYENMFNRYVYELYYFDNGMWTGFDTIASFNDYWVGLQELSQEDKIKLL